jgi:hypothetical protein
MFENFLKGEEKTKDDIMFEKKKKRETQIFSYLRYLRGNDG